MKDDKYIQERANCLARYALAAVGEPLRKLTPDESARIEREIAIAFTVGYAAGAEDQAGVIARRPISPAVIIRRKG